jgi:2'-5' RNA ligase
VTEPGTLDERVSLRLFLALVLPGDTVAAIERWGAEHLVRGKRAESLHVTLAFLGSRPRSELAAIVDALCESAADTRPFTLEVVRYRETRSVGMLVLDDSTGEAARLAARLHERLEALGVYRREARAWLPHVTVLRFRERPHLAPQLVGLRAEIGRFAPSEAAAFLSRLHPSGARHEILEKCSLYTRS